MENFNEIFTPETLEVLRGLYLPVYNENFNGCMRVLQTDEPLTVTNFGVIIDKGILRADDFRWFKDDGTDRDFRYNKRDCFCSDDMPDEVRSLLNTVICTKFATRHLNKVKAILNIIDNDAIKEDIIDAITDFDKSVDYEKLESALTALSLASDVLSNVDDDLSVTFSDAADVIDEVLDELC